MSGWRTRVPLHVLLGVACVFGSFGPGCARREAPLPSDRTLRIGQRNEPATLDPHLATLPDEFFIIRALGEGLLVPNPDGGEPLPGVATHWSVSPDGLTYIFTLRPDARWSNGEPVTAADFAYSIQRVLTPATAAPKVALFHLIRNARDFSQRTDADFAQVGVSARDARTLVLTLERPTPDFPALVASGPWIPVHRGTVETQGTKWTQPGNLTGNGPFVLTEWAPNQHILVRKNPAYWDRAAVELDAVLFRAFDSGDTEDRAFRAGELDITLSVPQAKLDTYRQTSPALLNTATLHETRYLSLNTTRPPLDDPRVRLALSLALDRQALTEKVLRSGQIPAYHFIPPGLGGYASTASLEEDSANARRLLAEAGFPDGKNFPRLELATWTGVGSLVVETIQQRWRDELGIDVSLVQREARTHLALLASGSYEIAFVTAIPDYDSATDLLQDLASGDAGNYPQWRHAGYDALLAQRALTEAEAVLLREMPLIPLYFNARNYLVRPGVRGWREDPLWTRYYKRVSLGSD